MNIIPIDHVHGTIRKDITSCLIVVGMLLIHVYARSSFIYLNITGFYSIIPDSIKNTKHIIYFVLYHLFTTKDDHYVSSSHFNFNFTSYFKTFFLFTTKITYII